MTRVETDTTFVVSVGSQVTPRPSLCCGRGSQRSSGDPWGAGTVWSGEAELHTKQHESRAPIQGMHSLSCHSTSHQQGQGRVRAGQNEQTPPQRNSPPAQSIRKQREKHPQIPFLLLFHPLQIAEMELG